MDNIAKPIFIIRAMEDSPDWLDRRLVGAYLGTGYEVERGAYLVLRIAHPLPTSLSDWLSAQDITTLAIITAWNPASKICSLEENLLKNNDLENDLRKVARLILPGLNIGDTGDWPPEESFWALDISAENAVRLGKQFGQNAVVWWQKGGLPELWWLF